MFEAPSGDGSISIVGLCPLHPKVCPPDAYPNGCLLEALQTHCLQENNQLVALGYNQVLPIEDGQYRATALANWRLPADSRTRENPYAR